MPKPLHHFIFLLLFSCSIFPISHTLGQATPVVDAEYTRYKKRGDDLFKEGKYFEARRQYLNCLEVPGFENDAYAKEQIDASSTGLKLRQQADEALQQGKGAEAIAILGQLLNQNPDDLTTKTKLADYYERIGNLLFNQKRYLEAKNNYTEALKFASATKQETLNIQIRTIDELIRPKYAKRIGLKVFTGLVAVGAGAYAYLLRNDYQTKMNALNQISQTADPSGTGVISNPDTYRQYNDAYNAAQAAQQKNVLFKACLGVAAVATLAEIYLLVHKPKPRPVAVQWKPSSDSWGLAVRYTF